MRLLGHLWDWLTSANKRPRRKGHPDLYPLDIAKLAKELDLDGEARRQGEKGHPAADAKALSGVEAAIVQRVEKARQDYVDWAVFRLGLISEDLARRNVTQAVNRAMQTDEEFARNASARITRQETLMRSLGDAARSRRAELAAFKDINGLTRDAHFPTAAGTFLLYTVLALLILVEGGLNAGFFAQGVSTGLLGGFSLAGGLAALNVVAAFVFGKLLVRNMFHRSAGRKVIGIGSLLLAILMMTAMGLGIAHVRDSLTAELADPAGAALQALLASPFHLRDLLSWALFAISALFGAGALLDGLFIDDMYPGYGACSRRAQTAADDYEDELTALRETLEELKEEQLQALDHVVQQSQVAISVSESLISEKKAVCSRLSNALRDADNSLKALLAKFRTDNGIHRGDAPRPSYFDVLMPKLRPLDLPNYDATADATALAEQRALVHTLLSEVQKLRASIQVAFNQQFDKLQPLDTHFPGKDSV